jgi:hypothetical protein
LKQQAIEEVSQRLSARARYSIDLTDQAVAIIGEDF